MYEVMKILFWVVLIIGCFIALFRGKIVVFQVIYILLFWEIIIILSYFKDYLVQNEKNPYQDYFQVFYLLLLIIITIIGFVYLRRRFVYWGIGEKKFLEVFHKLLLDSNLEFKDGENKTIIINRNPDETYHYGYIFDNYTGTYLYATNNKSEKLVQGELSRKIKISLMGWPLSKSSKYFIIFVILFSGFMIYLQILSII